MGGSYDGWFTFGEGVQLSLPDGDNIIRTGCAAAKIYGEFTTCPGNPQFDVGGFGQAFTPTAGMIYELSGYVYVSSGDPLIGTDVCASNRLLAKIVFFDPSVGGNEIQSNEIIIANFETPVDQWLAFAVSTPAPAGALRVEALFLFLQPACDEGSAFVDDVSFFEFAPPTPPANLLANPSFDTSLTGWSVFGNVLFDGRYWAYRTRAGCAKLYGPFALPGDASGMYQHLPAAAATTYELSVYSMSTCMESPLTGSNDNFATAKIVFRDAAGVELGSNEVVIADNSMSLGNYALHTVTATAPEGTASVEPYILFIQPTSMGGAVWVDDISFHEAAATAAEPAPRNVELSQNVPNPFNPTTRIDFFLKSGGTVDIGVYDAAGRRVATLLSGGLGAGAHQVIWDGRAESGAPAASGVYWYVLRTPAERISRAMVLLR